MMNEKRYLSFIILFACVLLFSVASIAMFIAVQKKNNEAAVAHSAGVWSATSLQREYLKLYRMLEQYATKDANVDKQALILQFEIFWSRVPLLENSKEAQSLKSIENYAPTVSVLSDALYVIDNAFDRLNGQDAAVIAVVRGQLDRIERPIYEFVVATYHDRAATLTSGGMHLQRLRMLLNISYVCILLSSIAVILLLIRQLKLGRRLLWAKSRALETAEHHSRALASEVSQHQRTERALAKEKEMAMVTLGSIRDAVITTDTDGKINYLNPVAETLTGIDVTSAMGSPIETVFRLTPQDSAPSMAHPVRDCLVGGAIIYGDEDSELVDLGDVIHNIEYTVSPLRDKRGALEGAVLACRDVTAERTMTRDLSYQATHDSLTGLFNRREFEQRLKELILEAQTSYSRHTLLYLDLDQFKVVNDTCGHVGGDDLLIRLGALLQSRLRPTDTLARLGGDEFGVLMRGRDEVAGRWVAERLRSAVDEFCFIWSDKSFRIGVSIGMVMIDSASTDSGQLMSAADIACYAAKESGRNNIHQYQNKDEVLVQRYSQMEWISRITQAIEDGRLRLFVQKIVSTTPGDSDTQCYETLLRMIDKDGSVIVPMAFLPAAERYNLMRKIDRWVVERLFALMREFPRLRDMHISVNLSGQTLGDQQLLNWIRDQLDSTAVNPERVMFEVTETVAIANLQTALTFMRDVRDKGCTIALDDFGSGLSSFNYLKTLPVDIIKIDGHFVKDVLSEPINAAVVESIVQISRHLGLKTVAEYVETQSIANTLKQIGVDYLQGFHVAKPVPIETLVASNATAPSPPRYSDKPLFEQKYPGNLIATP